MENQTPDDREALQALQKSSAAIREALATQIVGQNEVIDQVLMAIFARGHCIIEGVPGLAKTLLVSSLAKVLKLKFSRIQFTPDMMPSDITGIEILQEDQSLRERTFRFMEGPIFANLILADEINRTPPKTQAALLEAMQERHVSVGGTCHDLPDPFFVLATQNPIEQEGTYPLPEAQQDRFMFKVFVRYPTPEEEYQIAESTTGRQTVEIKEVLSAEDILRYQDLIRGIPVAPHVIRWAMRLARSTRCGEAEAPDFVRNHVSWGAGPRATQCLLLAGKARAALAGRSAVDVDDVAAVAKPVLRHRILTSFAAESDGITPDVVIEQLLDYLRQNPEPETAMPAGAENAWA